MQNVITIIISAIYTKTSREITATHTEIHHIDCIITAIRKIPGTTSYYCCNTYRTILTTIHAALQTAQQTAQRIATPTAQHII